MYMYGLKKDTVLTGMKLVQKFGYWSIEVREYSSKNYKLIDILTSLYNSRSFKASVHYKLAKENNLI